jgi:hypothetical protein
MKWEDDRECWEVGEPEGNGSDLFGMPEFS